MLTEGSVYELLRRDPRVRFDEHIAHAGLVYDEAGREILAGVHRTYLDIARDTGLAIVAFTDTWRASAERVARSLFRGRAVNRDNVEFLRSVAAPYEHVVIAGMSGPRADAYRPAESPSYEQALRVHAAQIEELATARVDLLFAATLPAFEEARAIAAIMSRTRIPWMLSFVIRETATLLDGTPLADAMKAIDDESAVPPFGYSVNCVHASVLAAALRQEGVGRRLLAFQANTSARAPEELDGRPELDAEEPSAFAQSVASLGPRIPILGGCCGTDPRHMRALAERLRVLS